MTNGSERIPEFGEPIIFTRNDDLGHNQVREDILNAKRMTVHGVRAEVIDAKEIEGGITLTLVPLQEGARRLAEYEVVQ